ncbi:MAG: S8 family serine peptidase [Haliscomenobacter sp.]|nr:S8 family serine peptidase [Haliscomenobacter sp.]
MVTSLDKQGQLVNGHGPNTVDLAAFGEAVYSTRLREGYREFSGTSFAAPQVAELLACCILRPVGNWPNWRGISPQKLPCRYAA